MTPSATGTSDVTDVSFAKTAAQYVRLSILKVVPPTWAGVSFRLYR